MSRDWGWVITRMTILLVCGSLLIFAIGALLKHHGRPPAQTTKRVWRYEDREAGVVCWQGEEGIACMPWAATQLPRPWLEPQAGGLFSDEPFDANNSKILYWDAATKEWRQSDEDVFIQAAP